MYDTSLDAQESMGQTGVMCNGGVVLERMGWTLGQP